MIYGGRDDDGLLDLATFSLSQGVLITGANDGDMCGISVSGAGGESSIASGTQLHLCICLVSFCVLHCALCFPF